MVKKIKVKQEEDLQNFESQKFEVAIISLPINTEEIIRPYKDDYAEDKRQKRIKTILERTENALKNNGIIFVYGNPIDLIKTYKNLPREINFRYWISIDFGDEIEKSSNTHLKHNHVGILMLYKGNRFINLNTKETRIPYFACNACNKNIKDWGGKKHLMNIRGAGISDVWKDFYQVEKTIQDPSRPEIKLKKINSKKLAIKIEKDEIPDAILQRLLTLSDVNKREIILIEIKSDYLPNIKYKSQNIYINKKYNKDNNPLRNRVILGDCIKIMEEWVKKYPEGLFDLVFADPPYNLEKNYSEYDDDKASVEYIEWCNKWLELSVKLTKPTGNILILNIPKWALEHAIELNKHAYFQNWIVWDALSTPKGKIMPAHYSLLFYSKSSQNFRLNNLGEIDSHEYCLRAQCINDRKRKNIDNKTVISDIWWDIHRIKHKKHRDNHPCQLPEKLMDRIVKIFSNEGDLVFDPFAGAGTTAIAAIRNKRDFLTLEIDPKYKEITERNLQQMKQNGIIIRQSSNAKIKSAYTKRDLEQRVQQFVSSSGRRPDLEEFINYFKLNLSEIKMLYGDPKQVLKAGRISLINNRF